MTTKEAAIESIKKMPDDATWEDIRERIDFIAAVRQGLQELDADQGTPHEQVKEEARGIPEVTERNGGGL